MVTFNIVVDKDFLIGTAMFVWLFWVTWLFVRATRRF